MNEREKYCKEINEVMEAWKKDSNIEKDGFYEDGIVCEDEWFEQGNTFRPLFLLKDVNINGATPKVCNFVRDENDDIQKGFMIKSYTWRRLAALAEGLKTVDCLQTVAENVDNMEYVCISRGDEQRYSTAINRVAIMNLKKSAGNHTISDKDLISHISNTNSLDHIKNEIKAISPTVIICCGTYGVCEELNILKEYSCKTIAVVHPHARICSQVFYNDTLKAYAEILANSNRSD